MLLRNLTLGNLLFLLLAVIALYMIGISIWIEYVPAHSRMTYETTVLRFYDCNPNTCAVEFADYSLPLRLPKPLKIGDRYDLLYEQIYNSRTGVVQQSKLLSARHVAN